MREGRALRRPAGGKAGERNGRTFLPPYKDLVKSTLLVNTFGMGVLLAGGCRAKIKTDHGDSQHRDSTCVC